MSTAFVGRQSAGKLLAERSSAVIDGSRYRVEYRIRCKDGSEKWVLERGAGVIDDFGTGYSSLAYLKCFPIDVLKIDRCFVMGCDRGDEAMAIPRAIISLGHSLHMRIVAEGVETASQLAVLAEHGCEGFQGYLFARPLTPEGVVAYLQGGLPD